MTDINRWGGNAKACLKLIVRKRETNVKKAFLSFFGLIKERICYTVITNCLTWPKDLYEILTFQISFDCELNEKVII